MTLSNQPFAAVLFFVSLILAGGVAQAANELDHIVAVVEDDVVLRSELDREMISARGRYRAAGQSIPGQAEFERLVLEDLILKRLQTAAAERAGVTVSDADVDQAIEGIAARNGLTMGQLREVLPRTGMSYEAFRRQIREQLVEIGFQRQQLGGKVQVTEAEIDSYLAKQGGSAPMGSRLVTQTRARQILIRTGERTSDQEAEDRLEKLRGRITAGEDFASLARANSDDTASALKGGDLGWVNPGDTTPEFQRVLDSLQPDAVSAPFKTPFGWHIVQVQERRQQNIADQAQREEAANKIRERKAREALELLSRQLRDQAYVEIRLDQPDLDDR